MEMDACFVDVAVEFLSVAFHNILYYVSVYPKSIFETRKKYNVLVYRCMHPEVNEYLNMCLESVDDALKTEELHRVELAVTDSSFMPGMKFVFDFDRRANIEETDDAYLVRCEQNIRAFCLKLATISHRFKCFPKDCSFAVYLHTNESTEVDLANRPELEDFPLVEVDEELKEFDNIMPLRRFSIRNYNIDAYIELPKPWSFCS